MTKPLEILERLEAEGNYNPDDLQLLKESFEDGEWVSDMYGSAVDDPEKNINRVLGGLKAAGAMNGPMMPMQGNANGYASARYVAALEIKIKVMDQQLRKLTNQNNKLAASQNKIIDRVNDLARKLS